MGGAAREHVGVERTLVLFTMQPGAENREAIRRSEPITRHWQPAGAVEPVFVLLAFLLQTIIKAV